MWSNCLLLIWIEVLLSCVKDERETRIDLSMLRSFIKQHNQKRSNVPIISDGLSTVNGCVCAIRSSFYSMVKSQS